MPGDVGPIGIDEEVAIFGTYGAVTVIDLCGDRKGSLVSREDGRVRGIDGIRGRYGEGSIGDCVTDSATMTVSMVESLGGSGDGVSHVWIDEETMSEMGDLDRSWRRIVGSMVGYMFGGV